MCYFCFASALPPAQSVPVVLFLANRVGTASSFSWALYLSPNSMLSSVQSVKHFFLFKMLQAQQIVVFGLPQLLCSYIPSTHCHLPLSIFCFFFQGKPMKRELWLLFHSNQLQHTRSACFIFNSLLLSHVHTHVCVCVCVCVYVHASTCACTLFWLSFEGHRVLKQREREREREKQTETDRDRDREQTKTSQN